MKVIEETKEKVMYVTTSKKLALTLSDHLCGPIHLIPAKGIKAIFVKGLFKLVPIKVIKYLVDVAGSMGLKVHGRFKSILGIVQGFNRISDAIFIGYGLHDSGVQARKMAENMKAKYLLLEDGFIRSVGLSSGNDITSSIVVDDTGIYYDSRSPSKIENLLNYDDHLEADEDVEVAKQAIDLIKNHNITKYNHAENIPKDFFPETNRKCVLVVDQTKNDLSIVFGNPKNYSFEDILLTAVKENPDADIYFKPHPESISGYKGANLSIDSISDDKVQPIIGQWNIISILKKMDKVYVMSSQVGLEALVIGKQVVCFGAPFYAGWGLTDDRVPMKRRFRKRSLVELFIATYIKYIVYINIETGIRCNVVQTIKQIIHKKKNLSG